MFLPLPPNRVYRSYTGGARIDAFRGEEQPRNGRFPEDWIASSVRAFNPGRDEKDAGLSRLRDGRLLRDVRKPMPILVKLLDADERLAIQAHPTRAFALERLGVPMGKKECWHVLAADPQAHVYLGFQEGVTRAAWEEAFRAQDTRAMLGMLHRLPLAVGDTILVEGGVPHAIGGGCLLLETQEASDLMVIPERTTPGGVRLPDEKMHGGFGWDGMFDVFHYDGASLAETLRRCRVQPRPPVTLPGGAWQTLLDGDVFRVLRVSLSGRVTVRAQSAPYAGVVARGSAVARADGVAHSLSRGDAFCFDGDGDSAVCFDGDDAWLLLCSPTADACCVSAIFT